MFLWNFDTSLRQFVALFNEHSISESVFKHLFFSSITGNNHRYWISHENYDWHLLIILFPIFFSIIDKPKFYVNVSSLTLLTCKSMTVIGTAMEIMEHKIPVDVVLSFIGKRRSYTCNMDLSIRTGTTIPKLLRVECWRSLNLYYLHN